jgi:hypothetical protein
LSWCWIVVKSLRETLTSIYVDSADSSYNSTARNMLLCVNSQLFRRKRRKDRGWSWSSL